MNNAAAATEASLVAARMDAQRTQLQQQFASPALPVGASISALNGNGLAPMQAFVPRSLLMKLLIANPQLLQRVLLLFVSGTLGSKLSPWLLRALRLWIATRKSKS